VYFSFFLWNKPLPSLQKKKEPSLTIVLKLDQKNNLEKALYRGCSSSSSNSSSSGSSIFLGVHVPVSKSVAQPAAHAENSLHELFFLGLTQLSSSLTLFFLPPLSRKAHVVADDRAV